MAQQLRLAFVVGNSAYTHTRCYKPLPNSVTDAADMTNALRELGFRCSSHSNLSQSGLIQAWQAFRTQIPPTCTPATAGAPPSTVVVVYFSGHGEERRGIHYLLPVDTLDAVHQGLDVAKMVDDLNEFTAALHILFLDACRSDGTRTMGGPINVTGIPLFNLATTKAEFLVACSCESGKVALAPEDHRNSAFTTALLKCIRRPHYNLAELLQNVRAEVEDATAGMQCTMDSSKLKSNFSFCPTSGGGSGSSPAGTPLDPKVAKFLQSLNLQHLGGQFAAEQIDVRTLGLLDAATLLQMGLPAGPRLLILQALQAPAYKELINTATPPPPAARPLGLEDLRCLPPRLNSYCLSAAVVLQGGVVVVEGDYGVQASRYDINKKVWTDLPDRPNKNNAYCSSCVLNGQLYLLGGGFNDQDQSAVQCFDPVTNVWSAIADLPHSHFGCGAAVLDGCLYVCGGGRNVACYDPARKTWAAATPMPVDVQYCSVVALADSIFVVVGDLSKSALVRYSPATRAWTELANLPLPRRGCAAVAFNGLLYVMGGRGGVAGEWSDVSDCWSYNPSTNIWTGIAPMPRSLSMGARAFVVHDCIWVVGGALYDATIRATFECYSPATNSWRP